MHIRVVKVDLSRVEAQLERIADILEGVLGATDPLLPHFTQMPDEKDVVRTFYTDDRQEIIDYHLRKLGKEPSSTPKQ
jgi:hypothetical protein